MNKSLVTYSIISFLIISFFGFNVLFSLIGNILILLFLTPILLLVIAFLGFYSFKSKFKICTNCGATSMGNNESCVYCGTDFNKDYSEDAGCETIEIEAEEIN